MNKLIGWVATAFSALLAVLCASEFFVVPAILFALAATLSCPLLAGFWLARLRRIAPYRGVISALAILTGLIVLAPMVTPKPPATVTQSAQPARKAVGASFSPNPAGQFKAFNEDRILVYTFQGSPAVMDVLAFGETLPAPIARSITAYFYKEGSSIPVKALGEATDMARANIALYESNGSSPWQFAFVRGIDGSASVIDCGQTGSHKKFCREANVSPFSKTADEDLADELEKAGQATRGSWLIDRNRDPMDNRDTTTLLTEADGNFHGTGAVEKPVLVLRCKRGETSAYVNARVYLGLEETTLRTRVDEAPAVTRVWAISSDTLAAGLWSRSRSVPFVNSLFKHETLAIEMTPYGESPQTVQFNLDGLSEAVVPLRNACHW